MADIKTLGRTDVWCTSTAGVSGVKYTTGELLWDLLSIATTRGDVEVCLSYDSILALFCSIGLDESARRYLFIRLRGLCCVRHKRSCFFPFFPHLFQQPIFILAWLILLSFEYSHIVIYQAGRVRLLMHDNLII